MAHYFQPIFNHIYNVTLTGLRNPLFSILSGVSIGVISFLRNVWEYNLFGVENILILLVILTIFWNTALGLMKAKKKRKIALRCIKINSRENKRIDECKEIYNRNRFDANRLKFVFFKILTFLAYLYFATVLIGNDENNTISSFLNYASDGVLKLPLAWFWYTEWKSVGENSTVLYGKKATIFDITEYIFEAKFFTNFKKYRDESN